MQEGRLAAGGEVEREAHVGDAVREGRLRGLDAREEAGVEPEEDGHAVGGVPVVQVDVPVRAAPGRRPARHRLDLHPALLRELARDHERLAHALRRPVLEDIEDPEEAAGRERRREDVLGRGEEAAREEEGAEAVGAQDERRGPRGAERRAEAARAAEDLEEGILRGRPQRPVSPDGPAAAGACRELDRKAEALRLIAGVVGVRPQRGLEAVGDASAIRVRREGVAARALRTPEDPARVLDPVGQAVPVRVGRFGIGAARHLHLARE